jgi:hypothetical protein
MDGEEPKAHTSPWLVTFVAGIVTTVVGGVVAGIILLHLQRQPDVVIRNWQVQPDVSASDGASRAVAVIHNDGGGTALGCRVHWVSLLGGGVRHRDGSSQEFSLSPNQDVATNTGSYGGYTPLDPTGSVPPQSLPSTPVPSVIFVECNGHRFPDSSPQFVTLHL